MYYSEGVDCNRFRSFVRVVFVLNNLKKLLDVYGDVSYIKSENVINSGFNLKVLVDDDVIYFGGLRWR